MSTFKSSQVGATQIANELVARLRDALGRHAITLPSLRADHPVAGEPLIELGRCNRQTTERLIAALNATGQGSVAEALPFTTS